MKISIKYKDYRHENHDFKFASNLSRFSKVLSEMHNWGACSQRKPESFEIKTEYGVGAAPSEKFRKCI